MLHNMCTCDEESVILVKWLMGITLAVATDNPEDDHAQLLDCSPSVPLTPTTWPHTQCASDA